MITLAPHQTMHAFASMPDTVSPAILLRRKKKQAAEIVAEDEPSG
ncbi:hypothetical protein [Kibdelosporangium aridum]